MSIQIFGVPVSRGVAIGRAVLIASSRVDVAHYYVKAAEAEEQVARLLRARDAVAAELSTLQKDLPADAPAELSALLESGRVAAPQPHVFPLERAAEAIASLEHRSAKGKVVLQIRG